MLSKLIKYEFKATSRFMLLAFTLFLALSAIISAGIALNIGQLLDNVSAELQLGGMILSVFVFMIIALYIIMNVVVLCAMFFYAIFRFKDNLLGNEGYLMHTLPVKTSSHILSKCFVSCIWTILSVIVAFLGYFILFIGLSDTNVFLDIYNFFAEISWDAINIAEPVLICVEFLLVLLISVASTFLHIYASMAIGYSFNSNRALISIGVYIAISAVINILETVVVTPLLLINLGGMINNPFNQIHLLMLISIILSAVTTAALYFVTEYFMRRRLNLQ